MAQLHRPIIGWTLAIVAGTALGFVLGEPLLWLGIATLCCGFTWLYRKGMAVSLSICLLALCLTGWRTSCVREQDVAVRTRLKELQRKGSYFRLKATVTNDRQIIWRKRGGPYCRFSVENAFFDSGTEIHGVDLSIYYYDRSGQFPETGETWLMYGKLRKNSWGYRMGVSVQGDTATHLIAEDRQTTPQYRFIAFRNKLAGYLALGVSLNEALLTQTMVLGGRSRLPYKLSHQYADAGIIHIFAISGLHIGIVAGLLLWIFGGIGFRLRTRAFLLLPLLCGYLLLTGVPPSAARACLMALFYCFAPCFWRKPDAICALFVTAAIVLLIEPRWIFNVGALLSFNVMGGILLYFTPLSYFFSRAMKAHPQRQLDGDILLYPSWTVRVRRTFAAILSLTLSAWIASVPLCLFFFGRVSLIGLLLNLFVPMLALTVVWGACISLLTGAFLPWLAIFLNRLNAFTLSFVDWCTQQMLRLPWAVIEVSHRPSVFLVLILEMGLITLGLWLRRVEEHLREEDPLDPCARIVPPLDA